MISADRIRPVSDVKARMAEILEELPVVREPVVITQNGEAKAIIQDIASYEETQETLALLKLLAIGNTEIEAGRTVPAKDVIARLRAKPTVDV